MYSSTPDFPMEVFIPLLIVGLILAVFAIIVQWKLFEKAGQPGWAILIPFYNLYVYTQVIQRPGWWMLLYFLSIVPLLGAIAVLVIAILDAIRLAKVFGKDGGFAVGLIFLGVIFQAILAFGNAKYIPNIDQGGMANKDLLDN